MSLGLVALYVTASWRRLLARREKGSSSPPQSSLQGSRACVLYDFSVEIIPALFLQRLMVAIDPSIMPIGLLGVTFEALAYLAIIVHLIDVAIVMHISQIM